MHEIKKSWAPVVSTARCTVRGCKSGPWEGEGGWPLAAATKHSRSSGHEVKVKRASSGTYGPAED